MESGLVLLQLAVPLLAVQLHVSWVMLGAIGWVAQAVRTPICFTSGHLSERIGRTRIIVPSAILCSLMIFTLTRATSTAQVMVLYAIALASIGAFYPPLQALIGDASEQGQLRRNLGMFNVGWCVGGAVAAAAAGLIIGRGLNVILYIGSACCLAAAVLVLTWRPKPVPHAEIDDTAPRQLAPVGEDFGSLLPIARMGHFTGFFGFSIIRILFPKMGIKSFEWSESTIASVAAVFLWGLGIGILLTNVSPWWRGKIWPQIAAQAVMLASAGGTALVCSPILAGLRSPAVIGGLFLVFGVAQSVAYTGALYYGLSSRKGKGTNTGIHESLVAAACVSGCLLGGVVAQKTDVYSPFVLTAGLAAACLLATWWLWARRQERPASVQT